MHIRAPKDFWTGIMFIAFAAVALAAARGYSLGTATRMGPGYFPMLLGGVLAILGLILVGRSFVITGEPLEGLRLLPLAVIAGSVIAFGLLLERVGLAAALIVTVVLVTFAGRQSRPLEVAVLALALAVFSVGVFVYGLRLPLPAWPQL